MIEIQLINIQIMGIDQDISKLPQGPWQFNSIQHIEGQLMLDANDHGISDIRVGYPIDHFVWSANNWLACEYTLKEV